MKTLKLLFASIFLFYFQFPTKSQVAIIDYIKVEPDKLGRYLELEEKWQKVHENRIKNDRIISWGIYEVMFTGTTDPYNYAIVTVYKNLDMFEKSWDISFLTESFPDMSDEDIENFYNETWESRDLVKTEVMRHVLETVTQPEDPPVYVLVNGMKIKPENNLAYISMERDIFRPLHEAAIKKKTRASWSLWQKFYGDFTDYQYITLDEYYSFKQSESEEMGDVFNDLHPDKDWDTTLRYADEIRTLAWREVWRLVKYVDESEI